VSFRKKRRVSNAHRSFRAGVKRVLTALYDLTISSPIDLSIAKIMSKFKSINKSEIVCGQCPPYWFACDCVSKKRIDGYLIYKRLFEKYKIALASLLKRG
jgi:hypothetical protein